MNTRGHICRARLPWDIGTSGLSYFLSQAGNGRIKLCKILSINSRAQKDHPRTGKLNLLYGQTMPSSVIQRHKRIWIVKYSN